MILEIKRVQYSYNSSPVLRDINMRVGDGEILGIIGPNGSGKSTLLKCMDRILKPQVGSVLLNEENINRIHARTLAQKIGFVPQSESGNFPVTVFDTILMGRKPHFDWKPSERDLKKVSGIIKLMNLEKLAMRDMGEISGGERQKVIIARALAQEPDVILLDEPTNNLDLRHQLEVLNLIKELAEGRMTAVIGIHDLNLAARFCDKFVMLKDGVIYAAGGLESLDSENLEAVYDVKVDVVDSDGRKLIIPECPV